MKQIIRELLEQYEKDMDMPQFAVQYYTDEYIISKHYGFIKWLVDNDKIDISKMPHYLYHYTNEDKEMDVLMNLAISDTPIDFLCEIIKK